MTVARLKEWDALGKAVQALSEDVNQMVLKPSQFKLFFEAVKRNIDQLSEHWKEPNVNEVGGAIPFQELQNFRKIIEEGTQVVVECSNANLTTKKKAMCNKKLLNLVNSLQELVVRLKGTPFGGEPRC